MSSNAAHLVEIAACRVCLEQKSRIFPITSKELKDTWQKLTDIELSSNTETPLMACYLCHVHLQKSAQLRKRAKKSEALLMGMISAGMEITPQTIVLIDRKMNKLHYNYDTTPTERWETSIDQSEATDDIKMEFEVELEQLETNVEVKEEFVSNGSEEDLINNDDKDAQENTYTEEKYSHTATSCQQTIIPDALYTVSGSGATAQRRNQKTSQIKVELFPCKKCSVLSNSEICIKCKPKTIDNGEKNSSIESKSDQTQEQAKPFLCKICDKTYLTKKTLNQHVVKKHMQKHKGPDVIVREESPEKSELIDQMAIPRTLRPFPCDICDSWFSTVPFLQRHVRYKHMKEKKFSCDTCNFKTKNKNSLIEHKRRHVVVRPYNCPVCHMTFTRKSYIQKHMQYKHLEKELSCTLCDYKCVKQRQLSVHIRRHTGEKPFGCDICGSRFPSPINLQTHMKYKHSEKKYSCDHCSYQGVTKSDLIRHMPKHATEKTFSCEICDNKYASKVYLQLHMQYKHTEKKLACHMCDYTCVQQRELDVHIRRHTGERPFVCSMCNTTYASKTGLNKHIKYFHLRDRSHNKSQENADE